MRHGRVWQLGSLLLAAALPLAPAASAAKSAKHRRKAHGVEAPATQLPKNLQEFLGPPPPRFDERFLKPALRLRAAIEHHRDGKPDSAAQELARLGNSELSEHSGFELATLYREKKEFAKSSTEAEKVLREYPGTVYGERLRDLLEQNECDRGLAEAPQAKTPLKRAVATRLLERCMARTPWREWDEREAQATALYELLKSGEDPLLGPFLAELIQAMPAKTELRQRIAREIPNDKLEEYAMLPRFRSKSSGGIGVKAVYPDLELFDSGMKAVLKKQWSEANALFKRLPAEFPQSEHWDRAQYWIARTEEKLGHPEEAEKRYAQILAESPLSYYGLQCALRLKRDLSTLLAPALPASRPVSVFSGTPSTRQALSLWRLRALITAGLLDPAREEAKFLFQLKAGGSTIGQDEADGALLMAALYQAAGYHQAAFSHAYAAVSLDPAFLSASSLDYIFPRVYGKEFQASAELTGVSPLLLYSVSKQESAFLPNVISRADAYGLMQLLYPTAQEVIPGVSRTELFLPARNTEAGAKYLLKLLERFQGNIALTLAGYNAGPSRAMQWQKQLMEAPVMQEGFDPDIFIDTIPITETRKYVGSILRNYAWYKLLAKDGTINSVQELVFQWQRSKPKAEPQPPPSEPAAAPAPPPSPQKIPPAAI